MFVVNHKKIFFAISTLLVVLSIFAISFFGLNFGIDFKGGAIIEVEYIEERPELVLVENNILDNGFTGALAQETGDRGLIVRTGVLEDDDHAKLLGVLSMSGTAPLFEQRFNTVGPVIGEELKKKAWIALVAVVLAIILFIAFVFRKVSEPVSSWKYGFIAILALAHDIIIPTGIIAVLGAYFIGFQIDILFVMALLAILGFSVNDTIVVFDRVRENLRKNKEDHLQRNFSETVGESLRQTYARSLNTSLTTLAVLVALYFIGGDATAQFALVLAIGVISGTYSSIFLASPLLVALEEIRNKKK